jgi:curved DNA-binding protein CbpA
MKQVHTHYDNLKVARNAPIEVIRAAYKALSQQYHPDRNHGDAESTRIMTILNGSLQALSDPEQRSAHDRWIAEREGVTHNFAGLDEAFESSRPTPEKEQAKHLSPARTATPLTWFIYAVAAVLTIAWLNSLWQSPSAQETQSNKSSGTKPQPYSRPVADPYGKPWPVAATYLEDTWPVFAFGRSTITVDNTRNDSDVHVKLFLLDAPRAFAAREFFIPAYGRFTLEEVGRGNYDVRYRDLTTGSLARSEVLKVVETETAFSNFTMTLHKVRNGNMKTYGLGESDF